MTARPDSRPGAGGLELACEHPGCRHTFRPLDRRAARYPSLLRSVAVAVGWSVRPTTGPGARSAPDLCVDHRPPP